MKKELKNNETCRYVCAARSNLQVMERHGITLREKFYRFMQGRYGSDQFNRFLMILALVCFVVSLFGAGIFYVIGIGILVYAYFRMLSKNVYKDRKSVV